MYYDVTRISTLVYLPAASSGELAWGQWELDTAASVYILSRSVHSKECQHMEECSLCLTLADILLISANDEFVVWQDFYISRQLGGVTGILNVL